MSASAIKRAPGRGGIHGREAVAGWLFTAPLIVILGVFLFIPIVMALYVSLTNWNGNGSPFAGGDNAQFVGLRNYTSLFTDEGLTRQTFMQSLNNNFWYVLLVVPIQTATSFLLALVVNNRFLKGRSFFRTAFYFPSVTSSIAISVVFLVLFANSGVVNSLLKLVGIDGPQWFNDARGIFHLGGGEAPAWATGQILGRSLWEWTAGPSVAMCVIVILAVWTTTGTFMLMFLAAMQDLPVEVDEAAALDGVSPWQKLRHVTIPMLRPTFFLVITLGLIGTWQVFDQIYVMGKGQPGGTTLTPAFLSYQQSFTNLKYGSGAAMAFVVFVIIILLTWFQRWLMSEERTERSRLRRAQRAAAPGGAA
ncbi:MAG TPA: sugar ABC transporter permease [Dermatophilaceae bacterium]|nr:sugar ABC transporter permease [Dermatophilaceae bacterium]